MDKNEVSRISHGLHAVVNGIIGDPVIIDIRRITTNLQEDVVRREYELGNGTYVPIYSGSKAEGLRFKSSDDDWMLVYRDIKVIPSDSFMALYDSTTTLLYMENEMTKPGFTLLRIIGEPAKPEVIRTTECFLNKRFVSCMRWRGLHTKDFRELNNACESASVFPHGPCTTFKLGACEMDFAFCLQLCDIWPTNAKDCIRRLHQCGLAVTWYHNQYRQWRCPLRSDWNQAVHFWEYWMENVLLFSRKEAYSFHESHTVSLLRTSENIP